MRIDQESLFIRVYDELEQRSQPKDLYENLSCSRLLRQLLLDERPLMDRANQNRRIKIRFLVTKPVEDPPGLPEPVLRIALDQIDPQTALIRSETIALKRDQFLNHKIMRMKGADVSVREFIKHTANKLGGVHLEDGSGGNLFEGLADGSVIYQLRSICRVTLQALKPLRRVCKSQF